MTAVQLCIVQLVLHSLNYVSWKLRDRSRAPLLTSAPLSSFYSLHPSPFTSVSFTNNEKLNSYTG